MRELTINTPRTGKKEKKKRNERRSRRGGKTFPIVNEFSFSSFPLSLISFENLCFLLSESFSLNAIIFFPSESKAHRWVGEARAEQ